MISLLTFSTLFPNPTRPNHGVFVLNRLRHLVATGEAVATVLAPVPWYPTALAARGIGGEWAKHAACPPEEFVDGLRALHPRFAAIPAIGMRAAPHLLYLSAARALGRLIAEGARFDAIDAHYFYPDGVAAVWLGRRFGLPVVVTARGSDITQFPDYPSARRLIVDAARKAAAVVTVSEGLRAAMIALGVPGERITTLRNGIDLEVFQPVDRAEARARYGISGKALVSVGALIERKNHAHTIAALADLPGYELLIAGDGPDRAALEALASRLGVGSRLRLLGPVPHRDLKTLYSAADVSVLASSREGWANVLLESMACGTPVVASPIPGNDEVVRGRDAGLIALAVSADGIAHAVRDLAASPPESSATRAYAEQFSWTATSRGQLALFNKIVA